MKKLILYALLIAGSIGCSNEYDDSKLWSSINDLENRVTKLEELCRQMNTNISSLQEIVTALQKNESIESVSTLTDGSGYLITFSSGKTITIYHGKNGTDGKDGYDGNDGITPTISVKKDVDGIYYWTVNGEWLIVDGNKVKAEGSDGKDGEDGEAGNDGTDGEDGITPKFKIENDYWYISYDNGKSWEQLGKATGDDGLNGADGQSFFKSVSIQDGYVCFVLNDEDSSIIKLPFVTDKELVAEVNEPGTLKSLLTEENMRTLVSLKVKGTLNEDDFATIRYCLFVVENVDLSETNISEIPAYAFSEMDRLKKVILPESCIKIGNYAFYKCRIFQSINAPHVQILNDYAFEGCYNLQEALLPKIVGIGVKTFYNCNNLVHIILSEELSTIGESAFENCNKLQEIVLPYGLNSIGKHTFYGCDQLSHFTFSGKEMFNADVFPVNNNVTHITVAEGASSLGRFSWATNVRSIVLPKSLTQIAAYTFSACTKLYEITCYSKGVPTLTGNPFAKMLTTLYVPIESVAKYRNSTWGILCSQIQPISE